MKLKDFNIVYGALLVSLLIAEICFAVLLNLYVIRFLQLFLLINVFDLKFNFLRNTFIFLVPSAIYLLNSLFNFNEPIVLGDIFNLFWWFLFMTILNRSIEDESDFSRFKKILFQSTFAISTLAALFGFYKLYFLGPYDINLPDGTSFILIGTALNIDYNVFSIGLYCGLFAGLYCYTKTSSIKYKVIFALAILIILTSSMMSGSRRGLVIGLFLIPYLLFWVNRFAGQSGEITYTSPLRLQFLRLPWITIFFFIVFIFLATRFSFSTLSNSTEEITALVGRINSISEIISRDEDTRSSRWEFSFNYFSELPAYSMLFGDGFNYLRIFGTKFGEVVSDYPHNVWLSALLYGGILGFLSTLFLTVYIFYLLYKRKHIFNQLLIWYVLFLFLYFSSANSIYSSRIFNVLMLMPFLGFCNKETNSSTDNHFEKKLISEI